MFQNRVLMRLIPNYFTLSEKEQRKKLYDCFKKNHKESMSVFEEEISSAIFGRNISYAEISVPGTEDFDTFNIEYIKLMGFGKSKIYNLGRGYELDFIHFGNLYDYDKAYEEDQFQLELELAQEQKNQLRIEKFLNAKYKFRLRVSSFLKLGKDDLLESLTVISGLEHVLEELRSLVLSVTHSYYPYKTRPLQEGEEPNGFLGFRGKTRDYNGKQEYADELKRFGFSIANCEELRDEISSAFESIVKEGVVVLQEERGMFDTSKSYSKTIVVLNSSTAKQISFDEFDKDISSLAVKDYDLQKILNDYSQKLRAKMEEHFNYIEEHFEPGKVENIRKTKVVFTSTFIEELNKLEEQIGAKEDNDE